MFKLIGNSTNLILQILLITVGVLLFTYFDPFGIFNTSQIKLKNTPISVQSMTRIGELVTAEYYGEVIASLPEAEQKNIEEIETAFQDEMTKLHNAFQEIIEEIQDDDSINRKKKRIRNFMETEGRAVMTHELYYQYLFYLKKRWGKNSNGKYAPKHRDKWLKEKEAEQFVRLLVKSKNLSIWNKITSDNLSDFKKVQLFEEEKQKKKALKKNRLVIIGRGWVKAGYDFGNFNKNNFRYDEDYGMIHFIGLRPEVLDTTINPWFIPEKGVEGFEIVIAKGPVRKDFKKLESVKYICINKLANQALRSGILQKATKNAAENLRAFFSILLEKPIRRVIFHNNYLDYIQSAILIDYKIQDDEVLTLAQAIDSVSLDTIMSEKHWENLITNIKASELIITDSTMAMRPFEYNLYTSTFYQISEDRLLTVKEQSDFQKLLNSLDDPKSFPVPDIFAQYWLAKDSIALSDSDAIRARKKQDFDQAYDMMQARIVEIERADNTSNDALLYFPATDSVWKEAELSMGMEENIQ